MEEPQMLGVLLPKKIKQFLIKEAEKKGLSVSVYARTILIEHLQAQTKKGKA
jgi:hypothetical protein